MLTIAGVAYTASSRAFIASVCGSTHIMLRSISVRRKHSRKKNGHRQRHSKIQITKIMSKGGKVIDEAKAVTLKKEVKKTKEFKLTFK